MLPLLQREGVKQEEKKLESDDLIGLNWRGIVVVCAYFVPASSIYAKTNEKRMIEVQQIALDNEEVIIATDANGWIGNLPSAVSSIVDGEQDDDRDYERKVGKTVFG